jgi:hypothetical protein
MLLSKFVGIMNINFNQENSLRRINKGLVSLNRKQDLIYSGFRLPEEFLLQLKYPFHREAL